MLDNYHWLYGFIAGKGSSVYTPSLRARSIGHLRTIHCRVLAWNGFLHPYTHSLEAHMLLPQHRQQYNLEEQHKHWGYGPTNLLSALHSYYRLFRGCLLETLPVTLTLLCDFTFAATAGCCD
jgi:hypothetical protein